MIWCGATRKQHAVTIHTLHLLLILAYTFLIPPQNLSIVLQRCIKRSATKQAPGSLLVLQYTADLQYIFKSTGKVNNSLIPISCSELVRFL